MLSCREMSDRVTELLEGRAGWSDRLEARAHLLMCRFCREYFKQLRATVSAIRCTRPPEVSVDPEKVLEKIERAARP